MKKVEFYQEQLIQRCQLQQRDFHLALRGGQAVCNLCKNTSTCTSVNINIFSFTVTIELNIYIFVD